MPHDQRRQQKPSTFNIQHSKTKTRLGILRFKADGSQVTLQENSAAAVYDTTGAPRHITVLTLRLDLKANKIWVGAAPPLPENGSSLTLGVVGLLRLERGSILVLVNKAKRICGLPDGTVYKVEDTTLVAPETINKCENDLRLAAILQEALNPRCFGSHLYFSHTANITSSRQRQADMETALPGISSAAADTLWPKEVSAARQASGGDGCGNSGAIGIPPLGPWWDNFTMYDSSGYNGVGGDGGSGTGGGGGSAGRGRSGRGGGGAAGAGGDSLWARADPRFVWNRELMRPLIDGGAEAFALPIMAGYVGQAEGATFTLRRSQQSPSAAAVPNTTTVAATATATATTAIASSSSSSSGGGGDGSGHGGTGAEATTASPGELTLITRIGTERPVAGSWRRGADKYGNTAGFAETEVMLTLWQPEQPGIPQQQQQQQPQTGGQGQAAEGQVEQPPSSREVAAPGKTAAAAVSALVDQDPATGAQGGAQGDGEGPLRRRTRVAVASYVMTRGSAPLFWSASPDLRLTPAPRGPDNPELHHEPFRVHLAALLKAYGKPVLLLNLIFGANQGPQLRLHDVLQQQAAAFNAQHSPPSIATATAAASSPESHGEPAARSDVAPQRDVVGGASRGGGSVAGGVAGGGPGSAPAGVPVSVVGMLLSPGELPQLAGCGAAAARLEREWAPVCGRRGAFVCVDEIELTVPSSAEAADAAAAMTPTTSPQSDPAAAAAAASPSGSAPGSGGAARGCQVACVGRYVHHRQEGVVRVSSASTASAGGCCGEVDLAQHALALPALAGLLVAVGALEDPADLDFAHSNVMQALAQLWSHMSDVLSDQALGTTSDSGRELHWAAARLGRRRWGAALGAVMRGPWRRVLVAGEAASRYYYGNFTDARRQDAYDMASGAFKVSYPPAHIPRRQPPNTTSLQLSILLLLTAAIQVIVCAVWPPAALQDVVGRVGVPLAIGSMLLLSVLRLGTSYVEQPLLLPHALYPWMER